MRRKATKKLFVLPISMTLIFATALTGCSSSSTASVQPEETEEIVLEEQEVVVTDNDLNEEQEDAVLEEQEEPAEEAAANPTATDSSYILPESDIRYYSASEISSLSKEDLRLARNEIYARRGRLFDDEELQSYFNNKTWYQGIVSPSDFSDDMFNDYEKANIKTIESVEDGGSSSGSKGSSSSGTGSGFSFASLEGKDFGHSSGAGAWGEGILIHADGSFEGDYHDSNMGGVGEGHPNGQRYVSSYQGNFSDPVKVGDYTYSVTVTNVQYEAENGTSEIIDGVLVEYVDEGPQTGDEILICLPGAPSSYFSESEVDLLEMGSYRNQLDGGALSNYVLIEVTQGYIYTTS